jgi:hypothetical protein
MKLIDVVDMAYQIIDMHAEMMALREEVTRLKYYEKKYTALLNQNIKDGEKMVSTVITGLLMEPKIAKAIDEIQEEGR